MLGQGKGDEMTERPAVPIWNGCPEGESVVSMVEFKGRLFVATSYHVFELVAGELVPLVFVTLPPELPPYHGPGF